MPFGFYGNIIDSSHRERCREITRQTLLFNSLDAFRCDQNGKKCLSQKGAIQNILKVVAEVTRYGLKLDLYPNSF